MDNSGDILQLCRLCLVKNDVNISIFEEQGDIREILQKISSCLPVKVSREDKLPKKICDGCSYKLDMFYEFWNSTANAEKQLLTWLGEAEVNAKLTDGSVPTVAQQMKPTETVVKQEAIDPSDIHTEENDDDKSYMFPQKFSSEEAGSSATATSNEEPPPPKRARRTAAVKAQIAMDPESDDDEDSGEPITKVEDESEESEGEDHEPSFVDVPSTSADDQPGPSGVGKDGAEAPNRTFQVAAAVLLLLITIGLVVGLTVYFTTVEKIARASVVTNGQHCADIGTSILERGGNAADAAIACGLCEGVANPQSMGLGGGFLLTIYNKSTGEVWSLNSREVAPGAANETMYNGDPNLSQRGGLSVAVPGELVGYWHLYNKFGGQLPWKDLIQPTIDLCKSGIYVTSYLARVFRDNRNAIFNDPVLKDNFIDPETGETYAEGKHFKLLRLAKTLETIADEGGYALHNGSLTEGFVNDLRAHNGIITIEDMNSYTPEWQEPIRTTFSTNESLYTAPLPGSGVILTFILNILNDYIDIHDPKSVTTYQRIIESFKFGYGRRTELGDSKFVQIDELISNLTSKSYAEAIRQHIYDNQTFQNASHYGANTTFVEDHGTAHISILAPNGDAVAITSTINYIFGAKFASESTGIILNNQMDDFSSPNITSGYNIPPSPANYIVPGKRPLSSMCPTIILDENKDVVLIIGAAGGTKITTAVALLIVKHLWFGMDLKSAMDDKRIHHQLFPMEIALEGAYATEDVDIVEGLHQIGHNYTIDPTNGFATITSISRHNNNGDITASSDKRRPGSVSYLY